MYQLIQNCEFCGEPMPEEKRMRGKARFCSDHCVNRNYHVNHPEMIPNANHGLDRGKVGAAGEMLASADLLFRGYDVYWAVSPHAPFDLVAYKDGKFLRVEVTAGQRSKDGTLRWNRHNPDNYDVAAVYFGHDIFYVPEFD